MQIKGQDISLQTVRLLLQGFSKEHLVIGSGMTLSLYVLIFGYVALTGTATIHKMEESLASYSTVVEHSSTHELQQDSYIEKATTPSHEKESAKHEVTPVKFKGLFEKTQQGLLPQIAPNGLTPFDAYKNLYKLPGKPMIAIAVLDYGLSNSLSTALLETLPPDVSLVITPYSLNAPKWQKKAHEKGHETWLNIPIETQKYPLSDPGPKGLFKNKSLAYNQKILEWNMSQINGYAGVAVFSDGAFNDFKTLFKNLLGKIFSRGVAYLELNPTNDYTLASSQAVSSDMPYIQVEADMNNISFKHLEKKAHEQGYAVGVIRPNAKVLEALKTWIETLPAKNIALAPVSAIEKVQ